MSVQVIYVAPRPTINYGLQGGLASFSSADSMGGKFSLLITLGRYRAKAPIDDKLCLALTLLPPTL